MSKISVEVFSDAAQDIDTDMVVHAIEYVNSIARNLEVIKASRRLRLGTSESVNVNTIRWPKFTAHINVVLTERTLLVKGGSNPLGSSIVSPPPLGSVAIVRNVEPMVQTTTSHELGHTMFLRYPFTDDSHCKNSNCLMQPANGVIDTRRRVKRGSIGAILEKAGFMDERYEIVSSVDRTDFCEDCKEQLAKKAWFLARAHQGETLAGVWLSSSK